jgi:LmeA-like phospholipid-binding
MRALRVLLIIVVILGGIFVAVDRLALHYAEGKVADRIRSSQDLDRKPDVSIKGFPFLTQVAGKQLGEVDVDLASLTATAQGNPIQVTGVKAQLKDVRIDSSFSSATAGTASGSAHISYAALGPAVPQGVTVGYAGADRAAKGQIKLTVKVTDLLQAEHIDMPPVVEGLLKGRTVAVYGTVSMADGDTLKLDVEQLPQLPVPGLDDQIKSRLNQGLKMDGIPSTVTLDKVAASQDGLEFSGTGTDVSLEG